MNKCYQFKFWHDELTFHHDENQWEANPYLLGVYYFDTNDEVDSPQMSKAMLELAENWDIPYNEIDYSISVEYI